VIRTFGYDWWVVGESPELREDWSNKKGGFKSRWSSRDISDSKGENVGWGEKILEMKKDYR